MATKWKPDPRVMRKLQEAVKKEPSSMRIAVGGRILTWQGVVREVEKGTRFGRRYYRALLEGLKESSKR